MAIGSKGIKLSDDAWLDAQYLYRINYGPASRDDVEVAYAALKAVDHDLSERGKVTLLDRRIGREFFKIAFPAELIKCSFCVDWTSDNEEAQRRVRASYQRPNRVGVARNKLEFGRRFSPFDFNPFAAESELLRACEEFCVNCVWDKNYASAVFGDDSRPPMAAVVADMMIMVGFFGRMACEKPRLVSECLRDFLSCNRLYSISGMGIDTDAACRGFLWDMLMIIVCRQRSYRELEGWDRNRKTALFWQPYAEFHEFRDTFRHATDHYHFPGGEILGLPKLLYPSVKMAGSLETLNAAFIHSGPYQLHLTSQVREHLTLDVDRRILLYWDDPTLSRRLLRPADARPGKSLLRTKPAIPGDSFSLYTEHALGR
jgi:hypothetical protein